MHVFRQLQVTRFKGDPGSQSWPESTAGGAFRPRPRGGRALHPASERSSNCTVRSGAFSDVSPRQRIVTREIDIPEALIRSRHFEKYFRRALPFAFFHLHKTAVPRSPLSPLRRVRFQIEAGAATKRRRIPANCPVSGFRSASYQQFPAEPPDNLSGFGRIMMSAQESPPPCLVRVAAVRPPTRQRHRGNGGGGEAREFAAVAELRRDHEERGQQAGRCRVAQPGDPRALREPVRAGLPPRNPAPAGSPRKAPPALTQGKCGRIQDPVPYLHKLSEGS